MTLVVKPDNLPLQPLILIYIVTWLLETIGQLFFWELPGPAFFGFIGMGSLIGLIYWRRNSS